MAGWFGLIWFAATPKVTLIWLPTGIAIAALLRWGNICAAGVFLGQLTISLTLFVPSVYAIPIAAGNALGPLLAAWILRRTGFRSDFARRSDIVLLGAAGAAGMTITAGNGVSWLHIAGFIPSSAVLLEGLKWWVGDWLGAMTCGSLLLLIGREQIDLLRRRGAEFCLCVGAICVTVWSVFVANSEGASLAFVPLPLIAWAALRFGAPGNALGLMLLSVGATYGTSVGRGPFKWHDGVGGIVALWVFMVTATVLGWLITVLHSQLQRDFAERQRAEQALKNSEEQLRSIVQLDPECVALLSPDGLVREMNPAGLELIEVATLEEIRGKPFAALVEAAQRESFQALHTRALQGEPAQSEYTIVGRKGTRRLLEGHSIPYRNGSREVAGVLALARDVTQRKRVETEMQESFSTLEILVNSVPAFISFVDADERYRLVNRLYEEYFGRKRDQLIGRQVRELQPAAAYAEIEPHLRAALGGKKIHYESNPVGLDGRRRWFDVHYIPRTGTAGEPSGVFTLVFDITERKQAEIRSNGERSVLEMLSTGAPLPEVLKTLALSYEQMFPGMLCSVSLLDKEKNALRNGAAPSLPRSFIDAIGDVPVGPETGSCGTAVFSRKTVITDDIANDPRWAPYRETALLHDLRACWTVPVIGSQGNVLGTFALYYHRPQKALPDEVAAIERGAQFAALAMERHQLHVSLRESRTRLETLIGNLPGIAFRELDDENWTLLYISEQCEKLTGYRPHELIGTDVPIWKNLIHPEDRVTLHDRTAAALAAGQPCYSEYRILDRAGAEHWVSERLTGVYDTAGKLLYLDGFIQDITAAREAARERAEFERKVQETQKLESLGVLAGGIAHDFNNILTAILGNASLALSDAPPETMLHACLEDISNASLRAAELCSQMLAYSGRGRFIVQKIDLEKLLQETMQMLQISISKNAALIFELTKYLPPFEADATQIRQVIMNLVINASEALGDNAGTITLRTGLCQMEVAALAVTMTGPDAEPGDYVFLEVSDTGCGMSAETQEKMFEPFYTTKFTGRGLGLAAVLGIVRGHRGALRVRSEPGRGTSFRLMFPASSGLAENDPERPATSTVWRGQGTILVADDEAPVRTTTVRMLESLGFETVMVNDGREAVQTFRETPTRFTMVLLDLTMPGLGGEQTFLELSRLQPGVRVVLMSGFSEQEAVQRFAGIGLKGFLQKPFTVEALREKLRSVVG